MLGALDCSQANVKVINACLEVDESLLELAVRQANHGSHVIELASTLIAKALELFIDGTDALRDLADLAAQRFELHARLANAPFDPFEPAVDLYESSIDLLEPSVDLYESSIDLLEPSVDLYEPFIDLLESSVDLYKSFIDLLESSVDLLESSVDLLESSVDPVEAFAHFRASLVDLFASLVDPLREVREPSIEEVDQFLFVQVRISCLRAATPLRCRFYQLPLMTEATVNPADWTG